MSNDLPYHPLADIFPLMEGAEFDGLVADIKANGLRELMTVYQNKILDGRNRYRACLAVGIDPHTRLTPFTGDDKAARAFVTSKNLHRRHLTAEKRRELIADLIKAQPEKSNNAIAKQAKVDDKTVAAVRDKMEARSEIPNVETTTDTKGRKQPKKKKRKAKVAPEPDAQEPAPEPDAQKPAPKPEAQTSAETRNAEYAADDLHRDPPRAEVAKSSLAVSRHSTLTDLSMRG